MAFVLPKKQAAPALTPCQQKAVDAVESGENVCITGPAGTGKSFLLEYLKRRSKYGLDVAATTGIAALNVGGTTIHAWAGLGLGDQTADEILQNLESRVRVKRRIREAELLAIDEISMASADLLELLDEVMRKVRLKDDPFGGCQLVFFGDFLQLPPVNKSGNPTRFAFEASCWKGVKTVEMTTVVRQADTSFAEMLHRIRKGLHTPADVEILKSRVSAPRPADGFDPIRLFNTNRDVDLFNWDLLCSKCEGEGYEYEARDTGSEWMLARLRKDCIAPQRLTLRVGAQVMLLKNYFDLGVVNGSVGRVESFDPTGMPVVVFKNGIRWTAEKSTWELKQGGFVEATRQQIPLRLAWGITIHKSQGMTLELLEADLGKCFEQGQAYVALSRAKTLDGLFLSSFDSASIMAHPKALAFYEEKKGVDESPAACSNGA